METQSSKFQILRLFVGVGFVTVSVGLLFAGAVPRQDDPEINKLSGCWTANLAKETTGKCPVAIKDEWLMCTNPPTGGAIQGNITANHSETLMVEKISPNDLMNCPNRDAVATTVGYSIAITKSPKNDLMLTETHHKCDVGECGNLETNLLKGKLTFDADALLFTRSDGNKLTFRKPAVK